MHARQMTAEPLAPAEHRIPVVCFRLPEEADFPVLAQIRRDPVMQGLLMAIPEDSGDEAVREWIARRVAETPGLFRVVADGATNAALGYAQITGIHRKNRFGYGGIALADHARIPGLGQATLRFLMKAAVDELGLRKLIAEMRIDNFAAIQLNLLAGYRIVGTLEKHFQARNKIHDALLMERHLPEPRA